MAPRRKPTASTSRTAPPKAPAKRRSKLAKENDITADQEAEIQDAFALFATQNPDDADADVDDSKHGVIAAADFRRCLIALDAPPRDHAELAELMEAVDPDATGWIGYEHFVAIAALKLNAKDAAHDGDDDDDPGAVSDEVRRAYQLFTKGEEREISLLDLRRVARELREDVPENVLKDMLREATGGGLGSVGVEDFQDVMRRAGVFS